MSLVQNKHSTDFHLLHLIVFFSILFNFLLLFLAAFSCSIHYSEITNFKHVHFSGHIQLHDGVTTERGGGSEEEWSVHMGSKEPSIDFAPTISIQFIGDFHH